MKTAISRARAALAAGDQQGYDAAKRSLPAFCYMATFEKNRGAKGTRPENTWRLQRAAHLTGLVMLDFDHLERDPREVFAQIPDHWRDDDCDSQILLAHVTPSGHGLRLVCKADAKRGNLADNQQHLSRCFGLTCDEAVKNADRISFAVTTQDIIYLDNQIFTYNNEDFDKMFGDQYRHSDSHPSKIPAAAAPAPADLPARGADLPADAGGEQAAGPAAPATRTAAAGGDGLYKGVPYSDIVQAWLRHHGSPVKGERHAQALRLAADLRYICDNNAQGIRTVMALAPFVQDMVQEGAGQEIDNICQDVVARKMNLAVPRSLQEVLGAAGCKVEDEEREGDGRFSVKYQEFWQRLEPLLGAPYDVAVYRMADVNKLGGVFAAGAMFCTLLTRCWYRHFDGEVQRMNPQVYLIGDPASGKGEAEKMDQLIMAPVIVADQVGRQAEAEYKRLQKERATSSKAQKGEALKRPEFCIRYLPSRTSNAVFFRRAKNAVEENGTEKRHLHLYTFDSELDGNITAQSGGSWIGKHDIELKAFHNEFTGVDYANSDSVNEIIQVFYNSVCTGTPVSLTRKINPRNINDGLCSRLAIFKMQGDGFKMIERGNRNLNQEKRCQLKQWAFKMDKLQGELNIKPLVDHVYGLCEQSALQAEAEHDLVLDYLRKRAVFYATWFTVPRIVARAISDVEQNPLVNDPMQLIKVDNSDLEFATLIYDAVIYWQDFFFGRQLQDSWDNAARDLKQRARRTNNSVTFAVLPRQFGVADVAKELSVSVNAAMSQVSRWAKSGYIRRLKKGVYEKTVETI